jgi:hypothetical protein
VRPRALVAPAAVVAVVAAALLVGDRGSDDDEGGTAAGADDPSSAPVRLVTDDEFCAAFGELAAAQEAQLAAASPAAVSRLKDASTAVADLAPGTAMSEDAQAGVDFVVGAFLGLPDDATAQDVVEADDAATLTDDAHAQALAAYLAEACGPGGLSSAS